MNRYRFAAAGPDGRMVNGTLEAGDQAAVIVVLARRGLVPVSVSPTPVIRGRPFPPRAVAVLLRGLGTLLSAGIPLDRALGIVRTGRQLAPAVRAIQQQVREGSTLSAALAGQHGIPASAVGLIRAGERADLSQACLRAAECLEREADVRYRIVSALAYPTVIAIVGAIATAIIAFVVLPRFVTLLSDMGATLPFTTRALLATSAGITHYWPWLAAVGLGIGALLTVWVRTIEGQNALLRLPWIGSLRLQLASAHGARILGTLLGAGAPALVALRAAADAARDGAVRARVLAAEERVRAGEAIGAALTHEQAFDPQVLELVAAGERGGQLPLLLAHAADLVEAEATHRVDSAVRLLEPGMIIVVGGLVGFVALALLQAVYGLRIR